MRTSSKVRHRWRGVPRRARVLVRRWSPGDSEEEDEGRRQDNGRPIDGANLLYLPVLPGPIGISASATKSFLGQELHCCRRYAMCAVPYMSKRIAVHTKYRCKFIQFRKEIRQIQYQSPLRSASSRLGESRARGAHTGTNRRATADRIQYVYLTHTHSSEEEKGVGKIRGV